MFRLAITLGKSIAEVERLPAAEIAEWQAYHQTIEPLPDVAWLAGMLASVMTSLWTEKQTTPYDFMPHVDMDDDDELPGQSAEEALVRFRLLTIGHPSATQD